MKLSLLRSLTPFSTSFLDSRWKIFCFILNAVFLACALVSVAIVATIDPWNLGHISSGIITLAAWCVCGLIPQIPSIEFQEKKNNEYVNVLIINAKTDSSNLGSKNLYSPTDGFSSAENNVDKDMPSIEDSTHKDDSKVSSFADGPKSPFARPEIEERFHEIISEYEDEMINPSEGLAIAKALIYINGETPGPRQFLKIKTQKGILEWLVWKYKNKFTTPKITTYVSAKKSDDHISFWKKKLSGFKDPK